MAEISVLMPVFNAEATLREAIDSILSQTFNDFEFIIIDDCSTDKSLEIIQSYKDPRIRVVRHEKNLKLIRTLNEGISLAQGRFIARMDADDVSLPQRFEQQISFLKRHPECSACGGQAIKINEAGKPQGPLRKPVRNLEVWSWIPTPLIHPTVMIRSNVAKANLYDETAIHCEDYEYWLRLQKQGLKVANVSKPLLKYRMHGLSVTGANRQIQLDKSYEVFCRYFPHISLTKDEYWAIIGVAYNGISWRRRLLLMGQVTAGNSVPVRLLTFAAFKHLRGRFQSLIGSSSL